jgi:hypothetical protein
MIPTLPVMTGSCAAWIILGAKVVAAMGFMAAADLVMLYAC